jgi:hypothetical protein
MAAGAGEQAEEMLRLVARLTSPQVRIGVGAASQHI